MSIMFEIHCLQFSFQTLMNIWLMPLVPVDMSVLVVWYMLIFRNQQLWHLIFYPYFKVLLIYKKCWSGLLSVSQCICTLSWSVQCLSSTEFTWKFQAPQLPSFVVTISCQNNGKMALKLPLQAPEFCQNTLLKVCIAV